MDALLKKISASAGAQVPRWLNFFVASATQCEVAPLALTPSVTKVACLACSIAGRAAALVLGGAFLTWLAGFTSIAASL